MPRPRAWDTPRTDVARGCALLRENGSQNKRPHPLGGRSTVITDTDRRAIRPSAHVAMHGAETQGQRGLAAHTGLRGRAALASPPSPPSPCSLVFRLMRAEKTVVDGRKDEGEHPSLPRTLGSRPPVPPPATDERE